MSDETNEQPIVVAPIKVIPTKELSREDILGSNDYKIVLVTVPEWSGSVYVKVITAKDRETWEGKRYEGVVTNCFVKLLLIAMSCCDSTGKTLFTIDDVAALSEKSISAIDRIYEVTENLNVVSVAAIEAEKKDSNTTP